jgi:valyl-tRNA synthetase
VRVGMLLCSPAGNDLMFDESYCEQGRNFANKIWNAFRLVKGWEVDEKLDFASAKAVNWYEHRFNEALAEIEQHFSQYRLSEALMATYKLVWDDFCAWYLEMVKPAYQHPIDKQTFEATKNFFERILTLLHPFMPFITEELWHDELFGARADMDCCIVASYPRSNAANEQLLKEVDAVKQIISEIRNIRNSKQISPKEALPLAIKINSDINYNDYFNIVYKLGNVSEATLVEEKVEGAASFIIGRDEFFVALAGNIDVEVERERISKELDYLNGFLKSVNAKLSNDRFVQNAKPEVIANERNKKADAEAKITMLEQSLNSL